MALDRFAQQRSLKFRSDRRFRADLAETEAPGSGEKLLLVKPLTYMNLSGEAVRAVMQFYKVGPADVMVITDDFDLPLGRIRIRPDGSAGTHNGMKSLVAHLGPGFPRVRIGVGSPTGDAIDHVLGTFRKEEWETVHEATELAVEAALMAMRDGVAPAMNRFNPKPQRQKPPAAETPPAETV
jgi:PTH1 family peptidyl-tRNA hydrolase